MPTKSTLLIASKLANELRKKTELGNGYKSNIQLHIVAIKSGTPTMKVL